tara:strand:+ start:366 stop:815 length:450 start_codon:yes stop_codon:yes gene_type:complete
MSNPSDNNVINGVYVCHLDRNQDINTDIYKRNSTTKNDNNNLIRFPIPLNTRYTLQHVYDKKQDNDIPTKSDYYINNIDTETLLRGTFHPLQHNSQREYIPDTSSDLYHDNLYQHNSSNNFYVFNEKPNKIKINNNTFFNHTRQEIKDK